MGNSNEKRQEKPFNEKRKSSIKFERKTFWHFYDIRKVTVAVAIEGLRKTTERSENEKHEQDNKL